MKKAIISIMTSLVIAVAFAAPRFTADWYQANAVASLNKVVVLHIHSAKASTFKSGVKGYTAFLCHTAYKGELGGMAWVLVKDDKAAFFGRNYSEVKQNIKSNTGTAMIGGSQGLFPSKKLRAKMVEIDGMYAYMAEIN